MFIFSLNKERDEKMRSEKEKKKHKKQSPRKLKKKEKHVGRSLDP